jgi:hypothetical protein
MREIGNYAPFELKTQTILTFFQMSANALEFEFKTWLTPGDFESDEDPFELLSDSFKIEGAQLEGVRASAPEVFAAIDKRIGELGEASNDYKITDWAIDALRTTFTINRESTIGVTLRPIVFSDGFKNGFTAQMQSPANLQLRQMVGGFCLSFAAGVKRPNQKLYQTILAGLQG